MAKAQFMLVAGSSRSAGGSSEPWYAWRLVGANSRPLAQSAEPFEQLDACRQSVEELPGLLPSSEIRFTTEQGSGLWEWQLRTTERQLAQSARAYQRQRECRYSADAFVKALESARLSSTVVRMPAGRTAGEVLRPRAGQSPVANEAS